VAEVGSQPRPGLVHLPRVSQKTLWLFSGASRSASANYTYSVILETQYHIVDYAGKASA